MRGGIAKNFADGPTTVKGVNTKWNYCHLGMGKTIQAAALMFSKQEISQKICESKEVLHCLWEMRLPACDDGESLHIAEKT